MVTCTQIPQMYTQCNKLVTEIIFSTLFCRKNKSLTLRNTMTIVKPLKWEAIAHYSLTLCGYQVIRTLHYVSTLLFSQFAQIPVLCNWAPLHANVVHKLI